MGVTEIPETCRATGYDYSGGAWRSIAVQSSGEVKTANGETLYTLRTVIATANSGGVVLGSGPCERIHVRVPEMQCSGDNYWVDYMYSGFPVGIMLGGKSGNAPYVPNILSGDAFCVTSGKGIWMPPGEQKTLFVQNINEVYIVGEPSGYPCTFVAEVI